MKDSAIRFAARVVAKQPNPPRQVFFIDVLKTRVRVLLVVPYLAAMTVLLGLLGIVLGSRGSQLYRFFLVIGIFLLGMLVWLSLGALVDALRMAAALRTGLLMTGQVQAVGAPSRLGQSGAVSVQIGGHRVEKLFHWKGDELEYHDWVQLLVDPNLRRQSVALMIGPIPTPASEA
jgi:hypothetical protein